MVKKLVGCGAADIIFQLLFLSFFPFCCSMLSRLACRVLTPNGRRTLSASAKLLNDSSISSFGCKFSECCSLYTLQPITTLARQFNHITSHFCTANHIIRKIPSLCSATNPSSHNIISLYALQPITVLHSQSRIRLKCTLLCSVQIIQL